MTPASARQMTGYQTRLATFVAKEMRKLARLVTCKGRRLAKSAPHEEFYNYYDGKCAVDVERVAKYSSEATRYARIMVARAGRISGLHEEGVPSVCFASVETAIDHLSEALEAVEACEF
jgi:hypothetical protein